MRRWKIMAVYLFLYDALAVNLSYFLGLWLRFDLRYSRIPAVYLTSFLRFAPAYTIFSGIVFWGLRLYGSLWRFAGFNELSRMLTASVITTVFHAVGITAFFQRMPVAYYIVGAAAQFCLMAAARFSYRFVTLVAAKRAKEEMVTLHRAMVIGAGSAGRIVVRELRNSAEASARPVCVIDDNNNKWGRTMEGVPIVGGRDSILEAVRKYHVDQILLAIPTASAEDRRDILNICKETGRELKSLPGVFQLINGEVSLRKMRPVQVEDLLGREPIRVNAGEIFQSIKGKTVLITGGGGSIGSELCRQIAGHEPKRLIIFDIYENNAYEIEQELRREYGDKLDLVTLIGSVRDSGRVNMVFERYKPDIVYHAAAHKHVPLMESSPNEAIKNNVIGTYKTAYAALRNKAQRFVLISTDKAVNPTNIMGASKRICEMIIQAMDAVSREGREDMLPPLTAREGTRVTSFQMEEETESRGIKIENHKIKAGSGEIKTRGRGNKAESRGIKIESIKNKYRTGTQFVAVRFGNVLGSNGSVIPLFKKQIEAGGPVTVTHPDITRYFMTIPEAVSLVLQAGTYAWGGEIFVLDMGEPVKIDTLARNLIKLSGYKPDEDIKIVYSGLRPGEKLYEEKLMEEEGLKKTDNEQIYIGKPVPFDIERFLGQLERLAEASYANDERIAELTREIVPTFCPAGEKPGGEVVENGERAREIYWDKETG